MTTVGFIYKIINEDIPNEVCYVGSTCKTLNQRLSIHNRASKNIGYRAYNMKLYVYMREFGQHKFKIHLVEAIEFTDKSSLLERERHWINTLNPPLNTVKNPIVSYEEKRAYIKQWSIDNQEEQKIYFKARYEENKVEFAEYSKNRYEANKETIKTNVKRYTQEKARTSPMTSCPCSTKHFKEFNKRHHIKSKTHKAWLLLQVE